MHGFEYLRSKLPHITLRDRLLTVFLNIFWKHRDFDRLPVICFTHKNDGFSNKLFWNNFGNCFQPLDKEVGSSFWDLQDGLIQEFGQTGPLIDYPHQTRWATLINLEKMGHRCDDFCHFSSRDDCLIFDFRKYARYIISNTCPVWAKFDNCNKREKCQLFHPYNMRGGWLQLLQIVKSSEENQHGATVCVNFAEWDISNKIRLSTLHPSEIINAWEVLNRSIFGLDGGDLKDGIKDIYSSKAFKVAYIYFDKKMIQDIKNKSNDNSNQFNGKHEITNNDTNDNNVNSNNIDQEIFECTKELGLRLHYKWFGNRIIKTKFLHCNIYDKRENMYQHPSGRYDFNFWHDLNENDHGYFFGKHRKHLNGENVFREQIIDKNTLLCVSLQRLSFLTDEDKVKSWIHQTLDSSSISNYTIPQSIRIGLRVFVKTRRASPNFLDMAFSSLHHAEKFVNEFKGIDFYRFKNGYQRYIANKLTAYKYHEMNVIEIEKRHETVRRRVQVWYFLCCFAF